MLCMAELQNFISRFFNDSALNLSCLGGDRQSTTSLICHFDIIIPRRPSKPSGEEKSKRHEEVLLEH